MVTVLLLKSYPKLVLPKNLWSNKFSRIPKSCLHSFRFDSIPVSDDGSGHPTEWCWLLCHRHKNVSGRIPASNSFLRWRKCIGYSSGLNKEKSKDQSHRPKELCNYFPGVWLESHRGGSTWGFVDGCWFPPSSGRLPDSRSWGPDSPV